MSGTGNRKDKNGNRSVPLINPKDHKPLVEYFNKKYGANFPVPEENVKENKPKDDGSKKKGFFGRRKNTRS